MQPNDNTIANTIRQIVIEDDIHENASLPDTTVHKEMEEYNFDTADEESETSKTVTPMLPLIQISEIEWNNEHMTENKDQTNDKQQVTP